MNAPISRLPPITAALVLCVTGLEVSRDHRGMEPCSERGIGALRRKLGPAPPRCADELNAPEIARDQARTMLAGICRVCPHKRCRMKRWGIL